MNRHNMGINTRLFIKANYLQNDMSILAILNSGLRFQGNNIHYEWNNVKAVVSS
jgi:hypothetical protein